MLIFENEYTFKHYLRLGREAEFDKLFDEAAMKVRAEVLGKKFPMYIGGKAAFSTEEIVERSPIDGALIGVFQKGTKEHASRAVAAALAAFEEWRNVSYVERSKVILRAAELFRKSKFTIAAILSIENGKTRDESVGEVDEAIDFLNYYAMEMERNKGYERKSTIRGSKKLVDLGFQGAPEKEEKVLIPMKPYGVFGVIAPFNFPISISVGMSCGALVTGNTVVFKPSCTDNMTMLTGLKVYEIFKEAGLPDGVFNYVTGPGSEVGDELVTNRDVSGIVFTGSRRTGQGMVKKASDLGLQKVFIVETGGKNPAIVSKYADINDAVEGISAAAFGYCGQKCSACSRVYVQESIKEEFVSKLLDRLRSIRIGDPLDKNVYMGPLIGVKALEKYIESIEDAKKSGRLLFGGKKVEVGLGGAYVEPAVIEVDQKNRLMHEELFVPIIALDTFKKFDEAIAKANDSEYGLTAGLYSKNKKEIKEFADKVQSGVIYINRQSSATTGAIVGRDVFVGWKGSGTSGKGTGSKFYLQQFLREQTIAITK